MANIGNKSDRGKIVTINLKKPIMFNGEIIRRARIEIDHINYGLNPKTFELNNKRRLSFTVKDVEKFIKLLDNEFLTPSNRRGNISKFEVKIDCPVTGKFFDKVFLMVFDTDKNNMEELHTITLIPGWR